MRKLIIGNWKMNLNKKDVFAYAKTIDVLLKINSVKANYGFAIPTIYLMHAKDAFKYQPEVVIAAQNCYYEEKGAFTGETSYSQLLDIGVHYSLVGHSERRKNFLETNQLINEKVKALIDNKIKPILCIGESELEREQGVHFDVIKKQLEESLNDVKNEDANNLIIAYEPVWAIGTGKSASIEDVENMCKFIRTKLSDMYGSDQANNIYILYGGSVNSKNIKNYLSLPNINGALVGGASLFPKEFAELLQNIEN